MADIKKIKLPRSSEAYNLVDESAYHGTVGTGTLTVQTNGTSKGTFNANATENATINITAQDLGLSAALKFKGTKAYADIIKLTNAELGDVWIDGTTHKEYVCVVAKTAGASSWEELGFSMDVSNLVHKSTYNTHKHGVEITGSNTASGVSASGAIAAGTVLTGKTQKHLTISRTTGVSIAAGGTDEALGVGATFNTSVTPSTTKLSASASGAAVGVSSSDEVLGAGTTFAVTGGALTGATQASFDTKKFHGGSASVPTVINTKKFTGGSITDGAVTGGVYRNATAASWTGSVDANGTLTIGWTPNNIGEVTPISYTKQVLTPAAFQEGFYTAGTASVPASIDTGIFTPNVVGSVSAIGVTANTNDKVTAVTGVAMTAQPTVTIASGTTGNVEVVTGISKTSTTVATQDKVTAMTSLGTITQPEFTLDDTAASGGITFVADNASADVAVSVAGTAAAQKWTMGTATVGVPDAQA